MNNLDNNKLEGLNEPMSAEFEREKVKAVFERIKDFLNGQKETLDADTKERLQELQERFPQAYELLLQLIQQRISPYLFNPVQPPPPTSPQPTTIPASSSPAGPTTR